MTEPLKCDTKHEPLSWVTRKWDTEMDSWTIEQLNIGQRGKPDSRRKQLPFSGVFLMYLCASKGAQAHTHTRIVNVGWQCNLQPCALPLLPVKVCMAEGAGGSSLLVCMFSCYC